MYPVADTLLGGDSVQRVAERLFPVGARVLSSDTLPAPDTLPGTTAADLFGALSALAPQEAASPAVTPGLSPALQGILLLLGVAYVLLLSNHPGTSWELLTRSFAPHRSRRPATDTTSGPIPFLNRAGFLALLFAGLFALRLGAPRTFAPDVPQLGLGLLASAVLAGTILLQCAMLRLAGALTLTRNLTEGIIAAKRSALGLYALLLPPALLCYLPVPYDEGRAGLGIVLALTGIVLFLFLKETLELFVSKKVSISHWFLYLCIVELFPISLLWLLIARHG